MRIKIGFEFEESTYADLPFFVLLICLMLKISV